MSATDRNKGHRVERELALWLRDNGWPSAERSIATGSRRGDHVRPDAGDITGTPGIVWQVKSLEPATRAERSVPTWMAETEAQRMAGHADVGVLVVRRPMTKPGEWWAFLPYIKINPDWSLKAPSARLSMVPVRLLLDDAAHFLHVIGYGDDPPTVDALTLPMAGAA